MPACRADPLPAAAAALLAGHRRSTGLWDGQRPGSYRRLFGTVPPFFGSRLGLFANKLTGGGAAAGRAARRCGCKGQGATAAARRCGREGGRVRHPAAVRPGCSRSAGSARGRRGCRRVRPATAAGTVATRGRWPAPRGRGGPGRRGGVPGGGRGVSVRLAGVRAASLAGHVTSMASPVSAGVGGWWTTGGGSVGTTGGKRVGGNGRGSGGPEQPAAGPAGRAAPAGAGRGEVRRSATRRPDGWCPACRAGNGVGRRRRVASGTPVRTGWSPGSGPAYRSAGPVYVGIAGTGYVGSIGYAAGPPVSPTPCPCQLADPSRGAMTPRDRSAGSPVLVAVRLPTVRRVYESNSRGPVSAAVPAAGVAEQRRRPPAAISTRRMSGPPF